MSYYQTKENPLSLPKIAPGPEGYPLVGVIPKIGGDLLGFFVRMMEAYGDVVRLNLGPRTFYLVTHPDGVKHVLQDNNRNYGKGYDEVRPLIGNGLVSSEGEFWRRQRRLIQPAFHRTRIAGFAKVMVDTTADALERWRPHARDGKPLDIAHEMIRITQRVIARTMFSTDVGPQIDTLLEAFDVGLEYMNQRMFNPIPFIDKLPTPTNLRFRRAQSTLDEIMYGLIEARRAEADKPEDLLTMLLEARDEETGEGMDDKQIRDEVITIFFAGHETTASTLSWAWYLLANHPDTAQKVREEAQRVLGSRQPTIEDWRDLVTTRKVIDESLRLYPPAWMFARQALSDDSVCGYFVPDGATILLSPYATHRHPDFWDRPDSFDPSRFDEEHSADRHKLAYFPFGAGPRLCIGRDFALVEATLILSMMARAYRYNLVPGYDVRAQPIATLRPRPGVMMTLREA
jgi:cytochrome P450